MIKNRETNQKGFTIIELMIATAVLSTILLLVTVLMINIGNLYYKGINQSRIQDNVRSVTDEISQRMQLGDVVLSASGNAANNNADQRAYCIGSARYTYIVGVQIGTPVPGSAAPVYRHVLWRDDNPASGTCSIIDANKVNLADPANPPSPSSLHGSELIAPRSRLIAFSIVSSPSGSPYTLSVAEAYGDNDLLCSPSVANSCNAGAPAMTQFVDFTHGNLLCKGDIGQQFCATAHLETSVVRRLP